MGSNLWDFPAVPVRPLRRLADRLRPLIQVHQRMPGRIPAVRQHELPGLTRFDVHHQRTLEVTREDVVHFVDDREHLGCRGSFSPIWESSSSLTGTT